MHENFHIMKIDVPSGVGAPPLDTQLLFTVATCILNLLPQLHVLTVTSGFEVVQTVMKVEWKSATIMHGAQCVMTPGVLLMQELHADSSDLYQQVYICNCMRMLI